MLNSIIIDDADQLEELLRVISDSDIIIHVIQSTDYKHIIFDNISAIYIYVIKYEIGYLIPINHIEAHYDITPKTLFGIINQKEQLKYTFDKKSLLHIYPFDKLVDSNMLYYFMHNKPYEHDIIVNLKPLFKNPPPEYNIYQSLPLVKILDICEQYINVTLDILNHNTIDINDEGFRFYNDFVIYNLYDIESAGLYVDIDILKEKFNGDSYKLVDNNLIYTEYYLYTSTGRPSNRFGGINFAALNKDDGSREMLKSRHENGSLLDFDFEGYHLCLIAKIINYDLPKDMSIHEYLGRQYFQKNEDLTPEEYNKSKGISFQILYGGHAEKFVEIPYFNKVHDFITLLYKKFNKDGYINAPISRKKLYKNNYPEMNPAKFFNYYIQLLETEYSLLLIFNFNKLNTIYNKSKLVLYTYDSFLFDCHPDEKDYIIQIKKILDESDIRYKVKMGENYNILKRVLFKKG